MKIIGKNFYLRSLLRKDINSTYLSWLKDTEVNKFLEVRFSPPSKNEAVKNLAGYDNKTNFFFGIFDKKSKNAIGTMTLRTNPIHKIAYYGYLIGDKKYWGTKASIEANYLLFNFIFNKLKLRKVCGSTPISNIGSNFNFKKLGFILEGRQRGHAIINRKPTDYLIFGLFKKEWLISKKKLKYERI